MYPSNGYANTSFPDNNTNPSLGIQDFSSSSSCLFHFPSPYIQYEDDAVYLHQLRDILYQNDQDVVDTNENVIENTATSSKNETNMKEHLCAKEGTTNYQPVAKRKKPKKDRHSKINTALGPRDRRMRLSLDVAQKFFGLQDMLGFDKASKTVEWLLKQSKIAIKELTKGLNQMKKSSSIVSASSTSDCEVMSGLIEESIQQNAKTKIVLPSSCTKEKRTRRVRKPTFPPLAKESRIKARERARDRTKEKKKQQQLDDQQPINLVSRTSFGTGKESASTSQNTIHYINTPPSLEVQEMTNTREQQKPSQGTREETGDSNLFLTRNWCPSGFFDYQHGFGTPHEQQFTEFQFYGYNN